MPTIIVRTHNVQDRKSLLGDLRKVLLLNYGELNKRINSHGIVATYILFMNDHKDVATKLRLLLDTIPETASMHLFQLEDELEYDAILKLEDLEQHIIPVELLNNLLGSIEDDETW